MRDGAVVRDGSAGVNCLENLTGAVFSWPYSFSVIGVGLVSAFSADQDVLLRSCGTNPDNFYLSGGQLELLSRPFVLKPVGLFRVHIPLAFGPN